MAWYASASSGQPTGAAYDSRRDAHRLTQA